VTTRKRWDFAVCCEGCRHRLVFDLQPSGVGTAEGLDEIKRDPTELLKAVLLDHGWLPRPSRPSKFDGKPVFYGRCPKCSRAAKKKPN